MFNCLYLYQPLCWNYENNVVCQNLQKGMSVRPQWPTKLPYHLLLALFPLSFLSAWKFGLIPGASAAIWWPDVGRPCGARDRRTWALGTSVRFFLQPLQCFQRGVSSVSDPGRVLSNSQPQEIPTDSSPPTASVARRKWDRCIYCHVRERSQGGTRPCTFQPKVQRSCRKSIILLICTRGHWFCCCFYVFPFFNF